MGNCKTDGVQAQHEKNVVEEQLLNECATRMKADETTAEEREVLRNEVFLKAFHLYDDGSETFLQAFQQALQTYDPGKGEFSHYLATIKKRRKVDESRKESKKTVSLDISISDDNSLTRGDMVEDKRSLDPADQIPLLDSKLADLTAQILNFAERHHGKTANEVRRRWFRMFYTEDMTMACKETELAYVHERDIFAAMELDYLDYYMLRTCRRLPELSVMPLKPYHEIVPAQQSLEEPPIPLPADISIAFWQICKGERKTPAARSQQYKAYRTEVKELSL